MGSEIDKAVTPIRGKVARILNSRELALNIGSKDGVQVGMYFDVMDQEHENILDPDTDEVLGSIERPKVRVRVMLVQDRLSLASTFKKKRINVGGSSGLGVFAGGLSEALMPANWVTRYETLKTEEKTWENLEEKESYVKTSDPVVQVFPDEDVQEVEGREVTRSEH